MLNKLKRTLGAISPPWRESFASLGWALVVGLSPLWLGAIIFAILSKWAESRSLITQGQLALYASGMVATAFHLATWERGTRDAFRNRVPVLILSVFIVLVSVATYVSVQVLDLTESNTKLSTPVVVGVSLSVFALSVFVATAATAYDAGRGTQVIPDEMRRQTGALQQRVRDLDQ